MSRFPLAILIVVASLLTINRCANGVQRDFKLEATVNEKDAPVYSGPGAMHYATDLMPLGAKVEVFRFDPGGWCAIRPPAESFCLVPAESIRREADGIGVVLDEGTQVWVGTHLGAVDQPLWQVKLCQDERVEILGEASWPSPEGGPSIWYQIVPPAGEFRWIHRDVLEMPDSKTEATKPGQPIELSVHRDSQVVMASLMSPQEPAILDDPFGGLPPPMARPEQIMRQPKTGLTFPVIGTENKTNGGTDFLSAHQSGARQHSTGNFDDLEIDSEMQSLGEVGWRPARHPIRLAANMSPEKSMSMLPGKWDERSQPVPVVDLAPQRSGISASSLDSSAQLKAQAYPTFGQERLSEHLAALDIQLSAEIIKPPEYWHLDQISSQLVGIQSTATDDRARNQASLMLKKIEDLQRTRSSLLSTGTAATVASIASRDRPVGSSLDTSVELGATYDAYGWLNELTQENGAVEPSYVLQNSTGEITHQVTPAPGLNMNRYLKSKVGIVGQRGFNQKLKLNQVTADRVIVLEKGTSTARRF